MRARRLDGVPGGVVSSPGTTTVGSIPQRVCVCEGARPMPGPVRAAVIGCGHFGRYHAEKYAAVPGAELVAVP